MAVAVWLLLVPTLLALLPHAAASQLRGSGPHPQLTVDVGWLEGTVAYARPIGSTRTSVGAGVWGGWEPQNSFDRDVWEPLGLVAFARYQATPWLHADAGLAGARYQWADDCSDCSGTFFGLRAAAFVGRRILHLGPEISLGRAHDDRYGSDLGVLWGFRARMAFDVGR